MKARVKSDYRWPMVTLFGGIEFIKNEWRKVPAEFEKLAVQSEILETDESAPAPTAEKLLKEIVESQPIEIQPVEEEAEPIELVVEPEVKEDKKPKRKKKDESQ